MSSSSSSKKLSLKLLIDTNTQRVLFAEASKDFIDFLFNLLRLPIATVTRLLTEDGIVDSLGKLYKSVENLNDNYLLNPQEDKDLLLKPVAPFSGYLLPANEGLGANQPRSLYMCPNRCQNYVTDVADNPCPDWNCSRIMELALQYVWKVTEVAASGSFAFGGGKKVIEVAASSNVDGFVKGVVTYMVMDDLEVQPMSTISCFTLMNKFNIKDVNALQERVVELGMEEGIKLLKASLQSNRVLTSAFLNNMQD